MSYSDKLIAHACGIYDGQAYVNSLEAFLEGYKNGYRIFEIDLHYTKEKDVISYHSSTGYNFIPEEEMDKKTWGLIGCAIAKAPLLSDTKLFRASSKKILSDYEQRDLTPFTPKLLAAVCSRFPDVKFVLDTMNTRKSIYLDQYKMIINEFLKRGIDYNQIIPQFYNVNMARKAQQEFGFENSIYTLYRRPFIQGNVLKELSNNPFIRSVTISKQRLIRHISFIDKLHELGVECNTHTIDNRDEISCFIDMGVDMIYSHISPKEMKSK